MDIRDQYKYPPIQTFPLSEEIVTCIVLVGQFFDHDPKKVYLWFKTENPNLGYASPVEMMAGGKAWRLLKWIREQMASNNREDSER